MYKPYTPSKESIRCSAGALKRAFAFLLDILIIDIVIFYPFRILFRGLLPEVSLSSINQIAGNPAYTGIIFWTAVSMGMLSILYFSILEAFTGQTAGKILMRIIVKSENKGLRFWQCIVRSIFLIPVFPFIVLWAADIIYLFFNSKRQRMLEILSKTRTVEAER